MIRGMRQLIKYHNQTRHQEDQEDQRQPIPEDAQQITSAYAKEGPLFPFKHHPSNLNGPLLLPHLSDFTWFLKHYTGIT